MKNRYILLLPAKDERFNSLAVFNTTFSGFCFDAALRFRGGKRRTSMTGEPNQPFVRDRLNTRITTGTEVSGVKRRSLERFLVISGRDCMIRGGFEILHICTRRKILWLEMDFFKFRWFIKVSVK